VLPVVQQHVEESALLRHVRSVLVRAPHVGLMQLARIDERIAAHLDGVAVSGSAGTALCMQALERPGAGEVFAVAVRALALQDERMLSHVLALVPAAPEARRGVASALGWVGGQELRGVVQRLLASPQGHERELGITACRMHLVDPGRTLLTALADEEPAVRRAALRAAAALGRVDLLGACRRAMGDADAETIFWAAWASCLLGDRSSALHVLAVAAQQDSPTAAPALCAAMLASTPADAAALTETLSRAARADPAASTPMRRLLRCVGLLGDAQFVPWLIQRMAEPTLARLAGEGFSWITGADLARQDLETLQAPELPELPSDDADDDRVDLDEDDSLPWPDIAKVQAWWSRQEDLQACAGAQRLFSGQPLSRQTVTSTLKQGTQRRRAHAAVLGCVLAPGSTLFQVAAPATRQRRLLAQRAD
jgi:uncharacterized protein (TIGR02270 family)